MNGGKAGYSKKGFKLNIIFVASLMTGSFIYIMRNFEIPSIVGALSSIPWMWNALSVAALAVQYLTEALCFMLMLGSFGHPIRFRGAIEYTGVDLFYMSISPFAVGGIPAQALYMKNDGIPGVCTGMSIAMFTCLNKTAMLISSLFAVAVIPGLFTTGDTFFGVSMIYGFIFMGSIILFCGLAMLSPRMVSAFAACGLKILVKLRIIKDSKKASSSLEAKLGNFSSCSAHIKSNKATAFAVFALCLVKRFAMLVPMYFAYRGFHLSGQSFVYLLAVQAVLGMAFESFLLPGAIGAYETAAMAFYPAIFGESLALPAALYVRTFCYILVVLSSGAVVAVKHLNLARNKRL